jgi:chromosome segregation ATPase
VTADFARQLERELAEAREENTALQKQVDGAKNCLTAIQEAKDLCAKWEEEHAACLKAANDSMDLAEQAIKQRDALARIGGKLRNVCPSSCDDYVAEWDKALATLEGRAE